MVATANRIAAILLWKRKRFVRQQKKRIFNSTNSRVWWMGLSACILIWLCTKVVKFFRTIGNDLDNLDSAKKWIQFWLIQLKTDWNGEIITLFFPVLMGSGIEFVNLSQWLSFHFKFVGRRLVMQTISYFKLIPFRHLLKLKLRASQNVAFEQLYYHLILRMGVREGEHSGSKSNIRVYEKVLVQLINRDYLIQ